LAYIPIQCGQEHIREQVASLLWPERSAPEALRPLCYALSNRHLAGGIRHQDWICSVAL